MVVLVPMGIQASLKSIVFRIISKSLDRRNGRIEEKLALLRDKFGRVKQLLSRKIIVCGRLWMCHHLSSHMRALIINCLQDHCHNSTWLSKMWKIPTHFLMDDFFTSPLLSFIFIPLSPTSSSSFSPLRFSPP